MQDQLPHKDGLNKWINGEISEQEVEGHEDLKKILSFAAHLQVPSNQLHEEAWQAFAAKLAAKEVATNSPSRVLALRYWKPTAVAAVLILLVAVYFVGWYQTPTVIDAGRGELISQTLPDNSEVQLNAESSISYFERDWPESRNLNLRGEAYFEVEKGSSFLVHTQWGTVAVLGTSFNVLAREGRLEVACFSGKVSVRTLEGKEKALEAGQAAHLNSGVLGEVFPFNPPQTIGWQKGEFYFDNTPLNHVIAVIERQYNVEVDGPTVDSRVYKGRILKEDPISVTLHRVFSPLGIIYKVIDETHISLRDTAMAR